MKEFATAASEDERLLGDVALAELLASKVAACGGRVYYVGGFVRDRLLNRENKDVDVEVHGISLECLEGLLAELGTLETLGASFGIYNLHGHKLDICVPRRADTEGRGGRDMLRELSDPFVGLRQAALRRDLTINALYQDVLTGEVIDFFGGRDDLAQGVIRHVSDETFVQDPLRVLRVAQFAARLSMRVDPATTELCSRVNLEGLPSERVEEELRKALLKAPRPSAFFAELRAMGQLDSWFAEVSALIGVPQNPVYHPEGDVWNHTMRVIDAAAGMRDRASDAFSYMLAALCHDFGKPQTTCERDGRIISYGHEQVGVDVARAFLERVVGSTKVQAYVINMVELHMAPNSHVAQRARQKSFNHLFDQSCCPRDLLLLAAADDLGSGNGELTPGTQERLNEVLSAYEELMARPFVQGRDLVEAGMEPGPALGEVLRYAHKLRLAGLSKEDQLRQCLGVYRSLVHEEAKGVEGGGK